MMKVVNPNNELKEFSSDKNFTVQEGEWGDYYGAGLKFGFSRMILASLREN
jgi:hypothetical protein